MILGSLKLLLCFLSIVLLIIFSPFYLLLTLFISFLSLIVTSINPLDKDDVIYQSVQEDRDTKLKFKTNKNNVLTICKKSAKKVADNFWNKN